MKVESVLYLWALLTVLIGANVDLPKVISWDRKGLVLTDNVFRV
jgi:hypothetical protein